MRRKKRKRILSKIHNMFKPTKLFSEKTIKATIVDEFVGNINENRKEMRRAVK